MDQLKSIYYFYSLDDLALGPSTSRGLSGSTDDQLCTALDYLTWSITSVKRRD